METKHRHRTERITVVRIDESELASILRAHLDMPKAEVEFICPYGHLNEVKISETEITET